MENIVETIQVHINRMYEDVVLPEYKHDGDSGMDIRAYFTDKFLEDYGNFNRVGDDGKSIWVHSLQTVMIETGISVGLPDGYEIQVRPRSGLSLKQQLTVLNSPGTIDQNYTGPLNVILSNLGQEDRLVSHGDRIAQIVLQKVPKISWNIVPELGHTNRGSNGFGSTGIK